MTRVRIAVFGPTELLEALEQELPNGVELHQFAANTPLKDILGPLLEDLDPDGLRAVGVSSAPGPVKEVLQSLTGVIKGPTVYLVDGDGLALPGKSLPLKTPIHSILAELDLFVEDEDPPAESDSPEEAASTPTKNTSEEPEAATAPPWTQPAASAKPEAVTNDSSEKDEWENEAPAQASASSDDESDVQEWASPSEPVPEPVGAEPVAAGVEPTSDDTPPWASTPTPVSVQEPAPVTPEPVVADVEPTSDPAPQDDTPPWASSPQPGPEVADLSSDEPPVDDESDVQEWASPSEPVPEPVGAEPVAAGVEPTSDDTPPWASTPTPVSVQEPAPVTPEPVVADVEPTSDPAPSWASPSEEPPQANKAEPDVVAPIAEPHETPAMPPPPAEPTSDSPAATPWGNQAVTEPAAQQAWGTEPAAPDVQPAAPAPTSTNPAASSANSWNPNTSAAKPSITTGSDLRLRFGWRPPTPQQGRVLVVAAAKGGVGKTTVATWIATAIGEALGPKDLRAGLLDLNAGQFDIGPKLGVAGAPDITSLFDTKVTDALLDQAMVNIPGRYVTALCGPSDAGVRQADIGSTITAAKSALVLMRQRFPWTVIDTPAATLDHPIFTEIVLRQADLLLVVLPGDKVAINDCLTWMEGIEAPPQQGGSAFPAGRTALLLNMAGEHTGVTSADVEQMLRQRQITATLLGEIPRMDDVVYRANQGDMTAPVEAMSELANVLTSVGLDGPAPTSSEDLTSELAGSVGVGRISRMLSRFRRK